VGAKMAIATPNDLPETAALADRRGREWQFCSLQRKSPQLALSSGKISFRFLVRYQTIADVRRVLENFLMGGARQARPDLLGAVSRPHIGAAASNSACRIAFENRRAFVIPRLGCTSTSLICSRLHHLSEAPSLSKRLHALPHMDPAVSIGVVKKRIVVCKLSFRRQRGRLQSSSASRFTAGAFGFLLFIQSSERPERYRESLRFETMPSRPSLQACWKMSGPSSTSR
jgi:hypothetical protein